ncbi:MAG: cob(I)yrinic acid a,c-diamide adenosyltransferase, partial [Bacteroidales bacterium]|nr:cob(I)yrinic acid a,c-diamide adenosyltransferase [Bacteroidales bacterium]
AHCSLLREMTEDEIIREDLLVILDKLMSSASVIAADGEYLPDNMPSIREEDIIFLEKRIDMMDHELPTLNSFILPGGSVSSSQAHVARTICRRAERYILKLAENEVINEEIIKYFNRLSDYYFLLARKLTIISDKNEIPWKP